MKNNDHRFPLIVCLVLLAFICSIPATTGDKKITKKDVPPAVLKAFEQAYSHATVKGYAMEKEHGTTYYELETIDGKTRRDLLYTEDGKIAEIEETITMKDLPAAVAKAFAKESPKAQASKIEKVARGEKVMYEFSMGKGKSALVIDPAGTVVKHSRAVKKTSEKEEEEENEKEE
jgi:hypothetical protein